MKSDLKIRSRNGGESTFIKGTIQVDGVDYTIDTEAGASDRGTHAVVNGQDQWWSSEGDNPVENAVDGLFELVYDSASDRGLVDGDWDAHVVDGAVVSFRPVGVREGVDPHVIASMITENPDEHVGG